MRFRRAPLTVAAAHHGIRIKSAEGPAVGSSVENPDAVRTIAREALAREAGALAKAAAMGDRMLNDER